MFTQKGETGKQAEILEGYKGPSYLHKYLLQSIMFCDLHGDNLHQLI